MRGDGGDQGLCSLPLLTARHISRLVPIPPGVTRTDSVFLARKELALEEDLVGHTQTVRVGLVDQRGDAGRRIDFSHQAQGVGHDDVCDVQAAYGGYELAERDGDHVAKLRRDDP